MTGGQSRRLDLYNRLQEVLGTEPATTLMTYLPQVETPELLTRTEFRAEMREFRNDVTERFDRLNQRIDRVLLALIGGMFVLLAAIIGTGAFS